MFEDLKKAQLLDVVKLRSNCRAPGAILFTGVTLYFSKFEQDYVECWLDKEMTRKQILSPYAIARVERPSTGEVIYEFNFRNSNFGVNG